MTFLHLKHFQIPVACLFTLLGKAKQFFDITTLRGNATRATQKYLRVLSAEGAAILGVLGDFHLLDDLSERSTVSGTVFTANSDLDCVLSLRRLTTKY